MTRPLLAVFFLCTLAHPQAASTDQVYTYDPKVVNLPVPTHTPEAEMPDQARRQQLPGLCSLDIVIDRKGLPQNPHIVRCTDPLFADNSLKAVKQYRFQPATRVQDNSPVLFRTHVEISYRFGPNPGSIPIPRPHIRLEFLLPQQADSSEPDSAGIYTLSRAFEQIPRLQRFANAGFGRAAFSLDDGAGCIVALTLDETGRPTDAQITKCDDHALEQSALRSLLKSQFAPAILNGKPVPVHASVHLACEGFEPAAP